MYLASNSITQHGANIPLQAERMCVGHNKSSMWAQLPSERITILGDQRHVYVSLDKLIDNIIGHGMPLSFIMDDRGNTSNPGGINGCKMIKEMRHKIREDVRNDTKYDPDKTACDSLTLWSDAFITA